MMCLDCLLCLFCLLTFACFSLASHRLVIRCQLMRSQVISPKMVQLRYYATKVEGFCSGHHRLKPYACANALKESYLVTAKLYYFTSD